jgi:hypothetical protein
MAGEWPLRSFLELGALPSAVPCARYHCRQVLWEWRLTGLAQSAELLVSELVTNAITASGPWAVISPCDCGCCLTRRKFWSWSGTGARTCQLVRSPAQRRKLAGACCWWR